MDPTPPPEGLTEAEEADRQKVIDELEARLARPPRVGVLPPVAAVALLGALGVMWMQREDVSYFFSSRQPIELGSEARYHFDRLTPNRYVEIHGTPTVRAAYWLEDDGVMLAVGLVGTPVLVRRRALESEQWEPGSTPPRPDPRSFTVRGRLLTRGQASKLGDAFKKHDGWGEVNAKWMLMAETPPGKGLGTMAFFTFMLAFAGLNLWLLIRGLWAALAARRS